MNSFPLLTWTDVAVIREHLAITRQNWYDVAAIIAKQNERIAALEAQVAKLSRRRKKS